MYCQTIKVKLLLGAGSSIEARTEDGYSTLQLAVMKKTWSLLRSEPGRTDGLVRVLLRSKPDMEVRSNRGETMLCSAAEKGFCSYGKGCCWMQVQNVHATDYLKERPAAWCGEIDLSPG